MPKDCTCDTPSKAAWYTCLIIEHPDRDTDYMDWFSCGEHFREYSVGDLYRYDGVQYVVTEVEHKELR